MHELSLSQSMVGIIQDQSVLHDFDRVTKVRLEIGILSCVEPEALAFCFELATQGTLADGATLEILTVPGRAWCQDCEVVVPVSRRGESCPRCGGYRLHVRAGDEMRIKDLEVQ